jgi:hypothetical protein
LASAPRLADVADAIGGQQWTAPFAGLGARRAGDDLGRVSEVGGCDHSGDAVQGAGSVGVDPQDASVCVRAADEGDVQHPGEAHVVQEARAAAQEERILDPRHAPADVPERPAQRRSSRSSLAASRTAATMPV